MTVTFDLTVTVSKSIKKQLKYEFIVSEQSGDLERLTLNI